MVEMSSRTRLALFGLVCFAAGIVIGGFRCISQRSDAHPKFINKLSNDVTRDALPTAPLPVLRNASRKHLPFYTAGEMEKLQQEPLIAGATFIGTTYVKVTKEMTPAVAETAFYKYIEHLDVECRHQRRYGNGDDGGWQVCLAGPFHPGASCLVYSFGIKEKDHVRGDLELIHFYHLGLGSQDTTLIKGQGQNWEVRTLWTHRHNLGDLQSPIDYLKFDVEFSEWGSVRTMIEDGSLRTVKQIAFEIHLLEIHTIQRRTSVRDFVEFYTILRRLEDVGFRKWYSRPNPNGMYFSKRTDRYLSCCYDLVYINVNFIKRNKGIT